MSITFAPNEAQQIRDACHLARFCSACGHPAAERNPLVLVASGARIHFSHVIDEDSGFCGMAFAESRPLADIADNALLADCGYGACWAESGQPCKDADGLHLARFGRAHRKGLISDPDMAVVLTLVMDAAGPGAFPGCVIPAEVLAGAS